MLIMEQYNMAEPLVSVSMVTYNHQNYIAQAIESVLEQKTAFVVELVIGEDCSPDDTREICLNYKEKYPDRIKLVFQEKNVGSRQNAIDTLNACTGKYIAICDGDDYWTDKNKLQKQVDFLERNPDFALCCHRAQVRNETKKTLTTPKAYTKSEFTQADIANHNLVQTVTEIFHREILDNLPKKFYSSISSDYFLNMTASSLGKVKYFPDVMAVYRQHGGGIWTSITKISGLQATLNVLYSFLKTELSDDVCYNLKKNIVRHQIKIYDLLKQSGKESEAKESLSKVLSHDFLDAWNSELESYITSKERKERKIGKLVFKPYLLFRKSLSRLTFFIHRLQYK